MSYIFYEKLIEPRPWLPYFANLTVKELNEVVSQLDGEQGTTTIDLLLRTLRNPNAALFVARDRAHGSRIIGSVNVNMLTMYDDVEGQIDNVAVLPAYRNRGIAERLMEFAIDFCEREGAFDIRLTCAPHRDAAGRLYTRLGFTEVETRVFKLALKK